MIKIPKFRIYGEDDPNIEEEIQPKIEFRKWRYLKKPDKEIAFQELINTGWITAESRNVLAAIDHLNFYYLRQCPGKKLHKVPPRRERYSSNENERAKEAFKDFQYLFINENSDSLIYRMLTKYAEGLINNYYYRESENVSTAKKRKESIDKAFNEFDRFAKCLNHIFEQFGVNSVLTRNGLVPLQDEKIIDQIYIPTLNVLANPIWKNVNNDLKQMFSDFQENKYPETITNAHRVVQRFLQILVGQEGKSGKGEIGKLFATAKKEGLIPANQFTEPIINVFQSFIVSQRATKSTAKPTLKKASQQDALLVMNVVIIFLQYCLQEQK